MPADTSFPIGLFPLSGESTTTGTDGGEVAEGMGTGGLTVVDTLDRAAERLGPLKWGMGRTALGRLGLGRLLNDQPAAPTVNRTASTATNLRRPWRR